VARTIWLGEMLLFARVNQERSCATVFPPFNPLFGVRALIPTGAPPDRVRGRARPSQRRAQWKTVSTAPDYVAKTHTSISYQQAAML
jgi:hypothetical protein